MSLINYSIQEVATGIFLLKMPLPFRLDHINLYLLEDVDGWILVDTGLNTETTKNLWIEFLGSGFFLKPLQKIILTHLHPDHIGVSAWLSDLLQIPVYISSQDWDMANFLWSNHKPSSEMLYEKYWREFGVSDHLHTELVAARLQYKKLVKQLPKNIQMLSSTANLETQQNQWSFIHTPGHTPGHLCLWNSARGILISGDQVLPTITPNISYHPYGLKNPLASYLESLEKLLELDCSFYLPAHGPISANLHERAEQLISHHQQRLNLLMENLGPSKTVHQALTILFPQELPTHQLMFAYAETAAHLLYLAHKNQLKKSSKSPWIFSNAEVSLSKTG